MSRKREATLIGVAAVGVAAVGAAAIGLYSYYLTQKASTQTRKGRGAPMTREDVDRWVAVLETPEREAVLQPTKIVELIRTLLTTVPLVADIGVASHGGRRCIADIGAGTGWFTERLVTAFPSACVYATDPEGEMLAHIRDRISKGSVETVLVSADTLRMGLPEPADVALLCNVYHHIGDGDSGRRVAYLRACHSSGDIRPGGYVVIIEQKPGDRATPGPPDARRLERSTIIREFEQVRLG